MSLVTDLPVILPMPGTLLPASPAACAPRLWAIMWTSAGEYLYFSWENSNIKNYYICFRLQQGRVKRGWKTTFHLTTDSGTPIVFQHLFPSLGNYAQYIDFSVLLIHVLPSFEGCKTSRQLCLESWEALYLFYILDPVRFTGCLCGLQVSARQELLITPGRSGTTCSWRGHEKRDAFTLFGQWFSGCNADVKSETWVRALLDPAYYLSSLQFFYGNCVLKARRLKEGFKPSIASHVKLAKKGGMWHLL